MAQKKTLTQNDIRVAFISSVHIFQGARDRWEARVKTGLTDAQLAEALHYEIGLEGGSSALNNRLATHHLGAGLKIWASWEDINIHKTPPILQGQQTINMARTAFGIKDPSDKQISLF